MPPSDVDLSYLKDEIGPILARGLAETATVCPEDPVEYLALWLLHYLQQKELNERKRQQFVEEEKVREEWNRQRQLKQGKAVSVIQREWKHFMKIENNRKAMEEAIVATIRAKEQELDETEEFKEETVAIEEFEGITEPEREKMVERAKADLQFKKAQRLLGALNKTSVGQVKMLRKPSTNVATILKCYFYLFGSKYKHVSTWSKLSTLIKPAPFLEKALAYTPVGEGNKKKRAYTRIRRLFKLVEEDKLRSESVVVYTIYNWLFKVLEFKVKHDEDRALRKENGREVEEEEDIDEEEQDDPDNVDPDEEKIRLQEEEEERLRKEEERRLRKERGELEEGEEGEE